MLESKQNPVGIGFGAVEKPLHSVAWLPQQFYCQPCVVKNPPDCCRGAVGYTTSPWLKTNRVIECMIFRTPRPLLLGGLFVTVMGGIHARKTIKITSYLAIPRFLYMCRKSRSV